MEVLIFTVITFGFSYIRHDETVDLVRYRFLGVAVIYAIIQAIANIGGF